MDKRKATKYFVKSNLEVSLQSELPPKGRGGWVQKKKESKKTYSHQQPKESSLNERESSYKSSNSTTNLSDDNYYDTPEVIAHESLLPHDPFGIMQGEASDLFHAGWFPSFLAFPQGIPSHENILVTDISSNFEDVIPDLEELQILRQQLAEKKLKKEREMKVRKVIE